MSFYFWFIISVDITIHFEHASVQCQLLGVFVENLICHIVTFNLFQCSFRATAWKSLAENSRLFLLKFKCPVKVNVTTGTFSC